MASANNSRQLLFAVLAVAASAILLWFGTGLFPWWPLMWIAPLPVLLVAARNSWWVTAFAAFAAWAIGSINMAHYFTTLLHMPLLVRIQIMAGPAVMFALAVLLFRALLRRGAWWSALIGFPGAWVSYEYLLNLSSPHGTALNIAYSELNFLPVLQLASLTGPWGISFLVFGFSAAVAIGIHLRLTAPKQAIRIVGTAVGVVGAVLIFGAIRLASPPPAGQEVRVGLVASDAPGYTGVAEPGTDADRMFRGYAEKVSELAAQGAQAVVIPENLGVVLDSNASLTDAIFQSIADKAQITVIVGVGRVQPTVRFNQARVYTPSAPVQLYAKHHLLPPFEMKFTPGKSLLTMQEPKGTWGVSICKDMDFTQLSRENGRAGVGLLLVPAWDFTLDRFEHGHMAVMRGVESGFGIARAARRGYLTISDNRGRIVAETQSDSAPLATLIANVPAVHDTTLYLLLGDWFAWVALALLVFTLAQLVRIRA